MENHLERRSAKWIPIEDSDISFPHLTDEQLRSLTFGVYQLKLCSSYIQEYVEGDSTICVHKDNDDLIRVRIQSRHVSSKKYLLWIKFSESEVVAWYCMCRAGARVVGVCAHIAAVVWYLSGEKEKERFGVRNWGVHLSDAANLPEVIDSSESETESISSVIEE